MRRKKESCFLCLKISLSRNKSYRVKTKIALTIIALCTLTAACSGCSVSRSSNQVVELSRSTDSISYQTLGRVVGHSIVIGSPVDLGGKQCFLPKDFTLDFKGGIIKNGILIGNGTKIERGNEAVFDHVTIEGNWIVPEISSKMFKDLHYDNAVRNVVALASPSVHNRIVIEKGDYPVSVQRESETCLLIESNTELILKGTVQLKPNAFKTYYILKLVGDSIAISGGGAIIGDKPNHQGNEGEWGMGIEFTGAKNASVKDITVKDCWGDCIYVGKESEHITIDNCLLDNGRRQGISVTDADGVIIRNCRIVNISGISPEYAIDIEPNVNCSIDHVLIENVVVENCEGGIITSRGRSDFDKKRIGEVSVLNCTVTALKKYPIRMKRCELARVEGCTVYENGNRHSISSDGSVDVTIRNNTIVKENRLLSVKKIATVKIEGADRKVEADNRVVK